MLGAGARRHLGPGGRGPGFTGPTAGVCNWPYVRLVRLFSALALELGWKLLVLWRTGKGLHLHGGTNWERSDGGHLLCWKRIQSGAALQFEGVLSHRTWSAADSTECIIALSSLKAVGTADGLTSMVLGDWSLESEETVTRGAVTVLNLGAVEGGKNRGKEGCLDAERWHAKALEERTDYVARSCWETTVLVSDLAAAAPLDDGVKNGSKEEEEEEASDKEGRINSDSLSIII